MAVKGKVALAAIGAGVVVTAVVLATGEAKAAEPAKPKRPTRPAPTPAPGDTAYGPAPVEPLEECWSQIFYGVPISEFVEQLYTVEDQLALSQYAYALWFQLKDDPACYPIAEEVKGIFVPDLLTEEEWLAQKPEGVPTDVEWDEFEAERIRQEPIPEEGPIPIVEHMRSVGYSIIASPGNYDPAEVKYDVIPQMVDVGLDFLAEEVNGAMYAYYGDEYVDA